MRTGAAAGLGPNKKDPAPDFALNVISSTSGTVTVDKYLFWCDEADSKVALLALLSKTIDEKKDLNEKKKDDENSGKKLRSFATKKKNIDASRHGPNPSVDDSARREIFDKYVGSDSNIRASMHGGSMSSLTINAGASPFGAPVSIMLYM